MTESIRLILAQTEDLDAATRASIIELCVAAHQEQDFKNLFSYISSGGRHFLAYHEDELVSHAVITTRWLQTGDLPLLKTAYVDAVATSPAYQGHGYGSAVMQYLSKNIDDYTIACLETEHPTFFERLGWEIWCGALGGRNGQEIIPTPGQTGIMILRLAGTPALNLDGPLTIEDQGGRIW